MAWKEKMFTLKTNADIKGFNIFTKSSFFFTYYLFTIY
jgi:hypothetical protein